MNYPKPSALRLLEGREAPSSEPKPTRASTTAPRYLNLSKEERAVWKRTVPELSSLGLFTSADVDAVGDYCRDVAWAESLRCRIKMQGESISITNKAGAPSAVRNHLVTTLAEVQDRINKFRNEFGMNPVARTRVRVDVKAEEKKQDLLTFIKKTG